MDSIAGSSSRVSEVVARNDIGRASRKHRKHRSKKYTKNNKLFSSVHSVVSNDDLLIEILLRLPVISLLLFKSVSKRWLKIITSPDVAVRRSQIPNFDPPLFLRWAWWRSPTILRFIPLDTRIQFQKSMLDITTLSFGYETPPGDVEIMQSCNGLLLCRTLSEKLYVCNPSINNMFKMLPQCDYVDWRTINMAFDPTKSPHYKVFQVQRFPFQLHTYSSKTGNWSNSSFRCDPLPIRDIQQFVFGIYWDNAIHWLGHLDGRYLHYKLDYVDRPIITNIQTPLTVDGKVPWNCMLFESCDILLFLCKENIDSRQLHIYEMRNAYCDWSMKYTINLDDFMMAYPYSWCMCSSVFCIVLGEREEDSFMVINLSGKIVQYKIVSKTLCTISDLGSLDNFVSCFKFDASFANV